MNKKLIHIKLPSDYFEGLSPESPAILVLQQLQNKIESHGQPGEFCCFATPYDIECLNDDDVLLVFENLLSKLFAEDHLINGSEMLFEQILRRLKNGK